jgi:hypothetical protein
MKEQQELSDKGTTENFARVLENKSIQRTKESVRKEQALKALEALKSLVSTEDCRSANKLYRLKVAVNEIEGC